MRARSPLSLAFVLALANASRAQEAPSAADEAPPPAPQAAEPVEEILVTITKREESLQDVPASVSAFSPEIISLANLESASDVVTLVPNVVTKGESRTGNISIRGVSESFSSQSPVAYHVNGVFKLDIDSLLGQYYDLESIELVRGPSGTVYGRNATAGAIDLRWRKPHAEWEASGDALLGNYDRKQLRAVLNAPLLGAGDERLMARLVLQRELRDGYMNDLTGRSRHDDPHNADEFYSRLTLRSLPTENLELDWRGFYNESDADPYVSRPLVDEYTEGFLDTRVFDADGNLINPNLGVLPFDPYGGYAVFVRAVATQLGVPPQVPLPPTFAAAILPLLGIDPSLAGVVAAPIPSDPLQVRSSAYQRHHTKLRVYGSDASLGWDYQAPLLGEVRLDLLGGWEHVYFDQVVDADGSELPILDVFRPHRNNHYTAEARLSSGGEGALDWIVGTFWFQHTNDRTFDEIILPFGTIIAEQHEVARGVAPFASVALRPLELLSEDPALDVEIFGGWRWNRDSIELRYQNHQHPAGACAGQSRSVFGEETWEVGARWFASERHTVYAKFAKGYKTGILEADNQTCEVRAVDPELIRAWEAGIKSTLWDGRLQLGLTGFLSDYTNLQVPQVVGLAQHTLNAAAATLRGIEVEAAAQPVDGLVVQVTAGYLHAVFDSFCSDDAAQILAVSDPGCPAPDPRFPWQGESNLAGKRLEDAPRWKTSLFASYVIDLGTRGTLTPVVKVSWTDDYVLRPYALPADRVSAYTRSDARLVWKSESRRFSVELFGENLEDEVVYARNSTTGEFSGSFPASLGLIPPRTYGVRVGFAWGGSGR